MSVSNRQFTSKLQLWLLLFQVMQLLYINIQISSRYNNMCNSDCIRQKCEKVQAKKLIILLLKNQCLEAKNLSLSDVSYVFLTFFIRRDHPNENDKNITLFALQYPVFYNLLGLVGNRTIIYYNYNVATLIEQKKRL